ncbi:MAG: hypothetical protein FJ134_11095 [Deltaproteobacteria bacterium]|nr:hypothetical protein [Deltaproteobacteria bacterium]
MKLYKNKSAIPENQVQPLTGFHATRRNLPHWQEPGSVYFLTWRIKGEQILSPEEKTIVLNFLLYWDNIKWTIYAAVIMSNHVHLIAQPLPLPNGRVFNLSQIVRSIKTYSSRQINALRGREGAFWQDERYDRIIRNEKEWRQKWEYLRNNPVEKGLCESPEDYPWLYEKC